MGTKLVVIFKFLGKFVDCKAGCSIGSAGLGQTLDCNQFIRVDVLGEMDHSKRAMIEKLDRLKASVNVYAVSLVDESPIQKDIPVKENSLLENILHTLHYNDGGG